mmetsp:Transcript_11250/g.21281  ORF Transcript_11250/g.21281 Transcript_11250/m.21281 type:complete len:448 (-) Transcript_11250:450-1793(-)
MISQFCVLSPRGDTIISREYRYDMPRSTSETFFRAVKLGIDGSPAPPVFHFDGINYFHLKAGGLLFMATSRKNCPPALVLELMQRVAAVLKDYCGILNEDSLRKNFILAYELLDEMIDYGCAANTSTEGLKQYIFNEPIAAAEFKGPASRAKSIFSAPSRAAAQATNKSVVATEKDKVQRDEVFVDIVERISVTFNSNGNIQKSEIDGSIMMKSFLKQNPDIKVALNESLSIGEKEQSSYMADYSNAGAGALLDDCNFHSAVRLDDFDVDRTLSLTPPDGEFAVMNYRSTAEFKPPFKVVAQIEEVAGYMLDVLVKVRADFPAANSAANVTITLPLPKTTVKASCQLGSTVSQTAEYKESARQAVWTLKKFPGGTEHQMRCRLTLPEEWMPSIKREIGPINMSFTIPMYNLSKLQVRYLQILNRNKSYNPYRWVRYVTQSNSYVCRI